MVSVLSKSESLGEKEKIKIFEMNLVMNTPLKANGGKKEKKKKKGRKELSEQQQQKKPRYAECMITLH